MKTASGGERGQGLPEYGLILFFVVLVGFLGVQVFGGGVGSLWANNAARVVAAFTP